VLDHAARQEFPELALDELPPRAGRPPGNTLVPNRGNQTRLSVPIWKVAKAVVAELAKLWKFSATRGSERRIHVPPPGE
jgi:hypothetical protein